MKNFSKKSKGFSLVEMLLAGAIFAIFAWGVVEVLLTGLTLSRQGQETTIAKGFATAGIEAVRTIKTENFEALEVTESTGIERQDGTWIFADSEDTLGKYTRRIAISEVQRDEDGNIVTSDGVVDEDIRKVTVTVTWDFTSVRPNTLVLDTYLTRWQD